MRQMGPVGSADLHDIPDYVAWVSFDVWSAICRLGKIGTNPYY